MLLWVLSLILAMRLLFSPSRSRFFGALIKSTDTQKQHTLKAKERLTNIKGSISLNENFSVKGKTILLCDDIKTTGATLRECTEVLLGHGAKDVYCATVAITSNLNLFDLDKEDKNK